MITKLVNVKGSHLPLVKVKDILTVDDEEPICSRCDNCLSEIACSNCGPEHGWARYEREISDD